MTTTDLELFDTQALIDELLRRTTFQGVIVHARDEVRQADWSGERTFSLRHSPSLDVEEAGRLLEVVSQYLARLE
jgi:hypothetical protein